MSSMDHLRLFPNDPGPRLRYKAEAEQREAELAAARKREERAEQRAESRQVTLLRTEIEGLLRSEIAEVYGTIKHQHNVLLEVCGTALGQYGDKIFDHCEKMIQSVQRELEAKIAQARADVLATAEGKSATKGGFKFANEKGAESGDEPVELPNPLPRRAIN
jgi:hypothetical protein